MRILLRIIAGFSVVPPETSMRMPSKLLFTITFPSIIAFSISAKSNQTPHPKLFLTRLLRKTMFLVVHCPSFFTNFTPPACQPREYFRTLLPSTIFPSIRVFSPCTATPVFPLKRNTEFFTTQFLHAPSRPENPLYDESRFSKRLYEPLKPTAPNWAPAKRKERSLRCI